MNDDIKKNLKLLTESPTYPDMSRPRHTPPDSMRELIIKEIYNMFGDEYDRKKLRAMSDKKLLQTFLDAKEAYDH